MDRVAGSEHCHAQGEVFVNIYAEKQRGKNRQKNVEVALSLGGGGGGGGGMRGAAISWKLTFLFPLPSRAAEQILHLPGPATATTPRLKSN